jgi:hypothetical protein
MSEIEDKEIGKEEIGKEEIGKEELRITKRSGIEDGQYNDIYKTTFPVTFYFDKEGVYDGLSFDTEYITEEEARILEELLDKLADEEDMSVTDEFDDE